VTAERVAEPRETVPAAVSVLTREQIERLPAENLAELLRYLPGFYLHFGAGIGGVPMVSSRGFFGGARRRPRERPANRGLPQADVDAGARRRRVARVRVHDQATVGDTAECSNSDALVSLSSSRGPGSPCRGSASRRARAGTRSATTSEIPAEPGSPAAAGAQRAARGENRGRQLKNIPEHLVRPGVSVSLPRDLHVEALGTILVGRFLDDGNGIPLDDAAVLDLRLAKGFGRWKARLDLLNVTNRNWEEVGLALPDARGELVPYYFPAAGFTARAGLEWSIQ